MVIGLDRSLTSGRLRAKPTTMRKRRLAASPPVGPDLAVTSGGRVHVRRLDAGCCSWTEVRGSNCRRAGLS